MRIISIAALSLITLVACNNEKADNDESKSSAQTLPYLGEKFVEDGDTVYHSIAPFGLTDQHGNTFTHDSVSGHIYVADFFFTNCPGQCPIMTAALKRVQQNCNDIDFLILSHTIDPKRDSSETFRRYIEKFGIDDHNWYFLTGDKLYIKEIGEQSYFAVSGINEDATAIGDLHSPNLYLIDKDRHLRGYYNGTDPEAVEQLIKDLRLLANEK